jgi:hypothetical protein
MEIPILISKLFINELTGYASTGWWLRIRIKEKDIMISILKRIISCQIRNFLKFSTN